MTSKIIDIADLDVIYLSYDEPQKEEFWMKIKNMVPWAKRVDGVKGSDAAHKAAGEASDTDRFIVVDGDNLPDPKFFDLQLDFDKHPDLEDAQLRWKAVNNINGLCYGNGGISTWTKKYVTNMKTHEAQQDDPARIADFCLDGSDSQYHAMWDCYSVTHPNHSPFQAWRAGFREGVKMCLSSGKKPEVEHFKESVANRNLNNLTIWHNVGRDVENGEWAIQGARYGTYLTMLTEWDTNQVQWFDNFPYLCEEWQQKCRAGFMTEIEDALKTKLNLPMLTLDAAQSAFFKQHLNTDRRNRGPLVTEMSVIRGIEGW